MVIRVTDVSPVASVTPARVRVSVTLLAPAATSSYTAPIATTTAASLGHTTTAVMPIAALDCVLLVVQAGLDTTGRFRFLKDIFAISDGMSYSLTKTVADMVSIFDVPPILEVEKSLADNVAFSDLLQAILIFIRNFSDTQNYADSHAWVVSKPFQNQIAYSDALVRSITKYVVDGFAMNDTFDFGDGAKYTITKAVNNVFGLSDTISQIIGKPFSDAFSFSDSGVGSVQDYCDITYFAEDYVGTSFTF